MDGFERLLCHCKKKDEHLLVLPNRRQLLNIIQLITETSDEGYTIVECFMANVSNQH